MDITPDYNAAPRNFRFNLPKYHDAIESCFECATSCWISADAFIEERNLTSLAEAIKACLTCAEVCAQTVKVLVAHGNYTDSEVPTQLKACVDACLRCVKEISQHCGDHEHCLICVKTCEECLRLCESYIKDFAA